MGLPVGGGPQTLPPPSATIFGGKIAGPRTLVGKVLFAITLPPRRYSHATLPRSEAFILF
jgi:hypothetical protein